MVYVAKQSCFYCNNCGDTKDLTPEAAQALVDYERSITQPPLFSLIDGTPVSTGAQVDRYGRPTYHTPGGITIPKQRESFTDRLRYEKEGIPPEVEQTMKRDAAWMESRGLKITETKTEISKSSDITSSESLRSEKLGTGLTGSGQYNPVKGTSRRISD